MNLPLDPPDEETATELDHKRYAVRKFTLGQWDKDDFTHPKKKKKMSKNRKHHLKDDITIEIGDDSAKSVRTPDCTTPTSATSATSPTTISSATGEGIGG